MLSKLFRISKPWQRLETKAKRLMRRRQWAEAYRALENALSNCPLNERPRIKHLWEECRVRIFETHLAALQTILSTSPSDLSGFSNLIASGGRAKDRLRSTSPSNG